MNIKLIFSGLIILGLSVSFAFYVGKSSQNISSQDINKLSNDLRIMISTLSNKLPSSFSEAIAANDDKHVEQVFLKAEELLSQGDIISAGLYFSNAISQSYGGWSNIKRYQESVLKYCHQRINNGDYEIALNVLSDMTNFIRTQAIYVAPQDIEKLQNILNEIDQTKNLVIQKIETENELEIIQFSNELVAKSKPLIDTQLSSFNETEADKLSSYISLVTESLSDLQSLNIDFIKENYSADDLTYDVNELLNIINALEKKLADAQAFHAVLTLSQQATQLINSAKNENTPLELIFYKINSADSIVRQLVLISPTLDSAQKITVSTLNELEKAKEEISKRESESVWNEVAAICKQAKSVKAVKAQDAINNLLKLSQSVAEKASNLSSLVELEKARICIKDINGNMTKWQTQQVRNYEKWAISIITNFYNDYKEQLGAFSDEDKIYAGLKRLGKIDLKYLSSPAQTAYNEAFQKFYAELKDEQKIPISSEMALMLKKPLSDF